MTQKTCSAPLGATYKQDVHPRWSSLKPDAAPNGAKHLLVGHGYKDFAPTYLGAARNSQLPLMNRLLSRRRPGLVGTSSLPLNHIPKYY